ncbi:MAG: transketolase family protein [Clostridia bacterium]|nr:transketolase family protein [Clostridia bacterium]
MEIKLSDKKIATRESYGNALAELGAQYPDLLVLDADLAGATKTSTFKKAFPDRHIDCGIAEANMTGIAAGLATTGKIPFISSFAMFAAGRNFEQVRNSIGYPHLNVKIGATHAGITVGEDGATHQCLEDLALMRTIPGMTVIVPSDDIEAKAAVKAALDYEGPVYLRFGRAAVPVFNDYEGYKFEIGKAQVLKEGTDVSLIANGVLVAEALIAAEKLEADGISCEVINMATIKPLDAEAVIKTASKTKKVVTLEEHSIIGGLGGAVAEVLAENCPTKMKRIGINDQFGQSADAKTLMKHYKLDSEGIYSTIKEWMS